MKGRPISYSAAELRWVKANAERPRREAHAVFCAKFGRDDVSLGAFNSLCKRKGWSTGRDGRFGKGMTPHNKGKPCAEGTGGRHPNAQLTQFRKGERTGIADKLWKPIGTERISKDGYRERKVNNGMPLQARWKRVQLIEWEKVNGPVPQGMCLKCLSDDKRNCHPSNWELIPRALLPRLNGRFGLGYDDAPPELKPTILAITKLEHAARERRKA